VEVCKGWSRLRQARERAHPWLSDVLGAISAVE
jgi:hypothetical protein